MSAGNNTRGRDRTPTYDARANGLHHCSTTTPQVSSIIANLQYPAVAPPEHVPNDRGSSNTSDRTGS